MKDIVTISFPGLGIEEFEVNKVLFSIGSLSVRWYGIFVTLGILAAFVYVFYRVKQSEFNPDDILDIGLFTVISGVIGARLYWVIFFGNIKSFWDIFAVWNGGLAIYGGIIGGVLAIFLTARYKKMKFLPLADMAGPGVMIAQAIGRWGNFFNGEAHGGVVAEGSPLYFLRMGLYPNDIDGVFGMAYVHPTFLYECLWNVLGFVLINIFYKKRRFDGEVALWYLAWYGFGRMFIEGLRTDSLMIGPFRVSQLLGGACFVVFTAIWIVGSVRYHKRKMAEGTVPAVADEQE